MGIKNLHNFLRKTCPQIYRTIPISKYAFKKISIDISIFMCKFKSSNGNSFMDSFLHLISLLRYYEVHFVFVYDSKAPPEKDNERRLRIEAREKNKIRVTNIRDKWENYLSTLDKNVKIINIEQIKDELLVSFLSKLKDSDISLTVNNIHYEIQKLENTILSIRSEDFNLTKEFFKACNIPFIDAQGEAEATCSELVKQGFVTATLTEDTDVLAYGVPFMLHKLDIVNHTFIEIDHDELLSQLQFTSSQFLDFCILCGTDYNTNMSKIGPDKSYKLLRQYGSIEKIQEALPHLPFETLNHHKVRSLFNPSIILNLSVPYCGFPDKNLFENLYFINNCKFDLNRIYNSFHHSIFHDFESKKDVQDDNSNKLI